MRYFPQLATGALGQYPLLRLRRTRTVTNAFQDGRRIRLSDPDAQTTEWRLRFEELTDGERAALEEFFTAAEGRLNTFTFLDPADNLLSWSEQLGRAVWEKDPLIGLVEGMTDPFGATRAWRVVNAGSAPQGIGQTINAPATYLYCFSVYARSEAPAEVTVFGGGRRAARAVGRGWSRLELMAQSSEQGETVRFGMELAAGGAVDLFGPQVEAQTRASSYRRTPAQGGVYSRARFGEDELRVTTLGPGRHACTLSVIHGRHF